VSGGGGSGRGSGGSCVDVVAKTSEQQRRSGISKWRFGGGLRHRAAGGVGTQRGVVVIVIVVAFVGVEMVGVGVEKVVVGW